MRPYKNGIYHPVKWRGWYDFGGGSIADFCCHSFSMPVKALDLDYPERIEISGKGLGKESFASSCTIKFHFPARGKRGPVTINFYTGGDMPPAEAMAGIKETFNRIDRTGALLIGDKGTIMAGLWNNQCLLKMKEDKKFRGGFIHDAAKGEYIDYLDAVWEKVRPGGLIIADNVVNLADSLQDYIEMTEEHAGLDSVLVPVGNGEMVSYKLPG